MEAENAEKYVKKLEIKAPSIMHKASSLSGGNQQKVAISKWLSAGCDVLIIDEPTVGVDVGAKEYIHDLIWSLAKDEHKAIFKEKQIVAELTGEDFFAQNGSDISAEIGKYFI